MGTNTERLEDDGRVRHELLEDNLSVIVQKYRNKSAHTDIVGMLINLRQCENE